MFVIILTYIKPLTEVDKYLEKHRAFLEASYLKGYFLASGPKLSKDGGVICPKSSYSQFYVMILFTMKTLQIIDYRVSARKICRLHIPYGLR